MPQTKAIFFITLMVTSIFYACSDDNNSNTLYYNIETLPVDTGGVHIAKPLGKTEAPYGYYVYQPSYYKNINEVVFPVLIFLHGSGEKGNSQENTELLDKVLRNGPPKMISKDSWEAPYPMLVFSPQCHDNWWNPDKLKGFTEYIIANYKVNVERIYLTGLSMGGYGTWNYLGKYADAAFVAAAVPICGIGSTNMAESFKTIPVWAFHGDVDNTVNVSGSIDMVEAINAAEPDIKAKITIYPSVGHNSWARTYNGDGMGTESPDYDAFNQSIYNWMFNYKRSDLDSLINY